MYFISYMTQEFYIGLVKQELQKINRILEIKYKYYFLKKYSFCIS